jgi:predicted lysophospholipase L1 biosynthesis ABC-type transport system permease subunit
MIADMDTYKIIASGISIPPEKYVLLPRHVRYSLISSVCFAVVGIIFSFIWFITGWGAFRAANHLTVRRSVAAFALAFLLTTPIMIASAVMAYGLGLRFLQLG